MNRTRNTLSPPVRKQIIAVSNRVVAELSDDQNFGLIQGHAAVGLLSRTAIKPTPEAEHFGTADLLITDFGAGGPTGREVRNAPQPTPL